MDEWMDAGDLGTDLYVSIFFFVRAGMLHELRGM